MDYKQEFYDLICSKQRALDKVMSNKLLPKNKRQQVYNGLKSEIDLLLIINKEYVQNNI